MPPGGVIAGKLLSLEDPSTVPAALTRYRNGIYKASVAHFGGCDGCGRARGSRGLLRLGRRWGPALVRREDLSVPALEGLRRVLRLPEPRLREWSDQVDAHGQGFGRRGAR